MLRVSVLCCVVGGRGSGAGLASLLLLCCVVPQRDGDDHSGPGPFEVARHVVTSVLCVSVRDDENEQRTRHTR